MEYEFDVKMVDSGEIFTDKTDIPEGKDPEVFIKKLLDKFNKEEDEIQKQHPDRKTQYREFVKLKEATGRIFCLMGEKVNKITIMRDNQVYDILQCKTCGLFRKRHGLGENFNYSPECFPDLTCNECNKTFKTKKSFDTHKQKANHKTPSWIPDGV